MSATIGEMRRRRGQSLADGTVGRSLIGMAALACVVGCQTSVLTPIEAGTDAPFDSGSPSNLEICVQL
jgi:hypothetical protein